MSLKDIVKEVIQFLGLVPAVLGLFTVTPRWFQPSEFYEPDYQYFAAGLSVVAFVLTCVYLLRIKGPVTAWTAADKARHFWEAVAGTIVGILLMVAYVLLVKEYPYASTIGDLVQMGLWASVFASASFVVTTLACIWKAP